jgi:peroxiredoxin Q/BCP
VVVGVSTDTLDEQEKFTTKEKLKFPLLADEEKTVAKAYGVLGKTGRAARQTFIIDKEGKLRKIYTEVKPANHPKEVVEFVKKKLAEK